MKTTFETNVSKILNLIFTHVNKSVDMLDIQVGVQVV